MTIILIAITAWCVMGWVGVFLTLVGDDPTITVADGIVIVLGGFTGPIFLIGVMLSHLSKLDILDTPIYKHKQKKK